MSNIYYARSRCRAAATTRRRMLGAREAARRAMDDAQIGEECRLPSGRRPADQLRFSVA